MFIYAVYKFLFIFILLFGEDIEQLHGVELYHLIGALRDLGRLGDPSSDDGRTLGCIGEQMGGRDVRRAGNLSGRIDNGLFEITLNGSQHGGIDDMDQNTEGICAFFHIHEHLRDSLQFTPLDQLGLKGSIHVLID